MKNTLSELMVISNEIDRALEQSGGEMTPELEQMLDISQALTADKVDQYDFVLKNLEAQAQFLKERAAEYQAAAKARSNAVEHIKERIKYLMVTHGKTELQGQYVRMQVSPCSPSLVIENEDLIPDEFIKTVTTSKIDNQAIKAALQNGTPVEGAKLKASYAIRSYAGTQKLGDAK